MPKVSLKEKWHETSNPTFRGKGKYFKMFAEIFTQYTEH